MNLPRRSERHVDSDPFFPTTAHFARIFSTVVLSDFEVRTSDLRLRRARRRVREAERNATFGENVRNWCVLLALHTLPHKALNQQTASCATGDRCHSQSKSDSSDESVFQDFESWPVAGHNLVNGIASSGKEQARRAFLGLTRPLEYEILASLKWHGLFYWIEGKSNAGCNYLSSRQYPTGVA